MYFQNRTLEDFSKKDFEEIKYFTYKDGMARPIFEKAMSETLSDPDEHMLCILRHEYKFILGWGLLYPSVGENKMKYMNYMSFVRPLFRKCGLGRKIINQTLSYAPANKEITVFGWNSRSFDFYSKIQSENLKKNKIVIV